LNGIGRWAIWPDGRRTRVRYEWIVAVTQPRLRLLGPLMRPLFVWNHNIIMGRGFKGLLGKLAPQRAAPPNIRKV
jgi:hypothetical protein